MSEYTKHIKHQQLSTDDHRKMINSIKALWFYCFDEKIDDEFAQRISFFISVLQKAAFFES